jgi:hypothetical protein
MRLRKDNAWLVETVEYAYGLRAEVERLRAINAELLAALEEIATQRDPNASFKECFCDEIARAAIAKGRRNDP